MTLINKRWYTDRDRIRGSVFQSYCVVREEPPRRVL